MALSSRVKLPQWGTVLRVFVGAVLIAGALLLLLVPLGLLVFG
jgi:hypothetical protein